MEIIDLKQMAGAAKPPFEALYQEYYAKVLFYIFKRTGNRADAEDLAGEAFLYAYDHYGDFDPRKSAAGTWLYLIVNSRLKNYFRDRRSFVDMGEMENSLFTDGGEMEKAVWLEQLRERINSALGGLPARQRDVVVMRYFKNMTHEQIALELGVTAGNARVILSRALDKLKEKLEDID